MGQTDSLEPVSGLPPFDPKQEPEGQGCFQDHAPQEKGDKKGKRLLKCGIVGCSGNWGCGGSAVGDTCPADDCPPWPATVEKCDGAKMSIEYCIQLCLAWSPKFSYAGVTYTSECWCDRELHLYGSADPLSWATSNYCVDHTSKFCNMKCKGDDKEICGGNFA